MSERKKIDDKDLRDVTGAGGVMDLQEDKSDQNALRQAPQPIPLPPDDGGGAGPEAPEAPDSGGGNQDLEI